VALSGDGSTALVGARGDENPFGASGGSAYVFTRGSDGWSQQAKLSAGDGGPFDVFGSVVALSGDESTALVGAHNDENPHGDGGGSAYVFTRVVDTWPQQAKLTASDGGPGDSFGWSVALSGDGSTALAGAPNDENPHGDAGGSAYVFVRGEGTWRQTAKLSASDGGPGDFFGSSVALSGDGSTALVAASSDENPNGDESGSAYVFTRGSDGWEEQAKISAGDGGPGDSFGGSVALSDDGATALVGASHDENPNGDDSGSAYLFTRTNGGWSQQAKLSAGDGDPHDRFGVAVALSGDADRALVGALGDEHPNGSNAGSAYVFARADGDWVQWAKLAAQDGISGDQFGRRVALSADGSTALVGAAWNDDVAVNVGSAYVFDV
jgi:hypothetical protein